MLSDIDGLIKKPFAYLYTQLITRVDDQICWFLSFLVSNGKLVRKRWLVLRSKDKRLAASGIHNPPLCVARNFGYCNTNLPPTAN